MRDLEDLRLAFLAEHIALLKTHIQQTAEALDENSEGREADLALQEARVLQQKAEQFLISRDLNSARYAFIYAHQCLGYAGSVLRDENELKRAIETALSNSPLH